MPYRKQAAFQPRWLKGDLQPTPVYWQPMRLTTKTAAASLPTASDRPGRQIAPKRN